MPFTLPELPYSYDALEPYIDAQTMELHHTKHHQAYTDKLNAALEKYPQWLDKSVDDILADLDAVPEGIRTTVRNNGGGYANHNLFWTIMAPDAGGEAPGDIGSAINDAFGSFADFKQKFSDAGAGQFGSGWAWLVVADGAIEITNSPNQDTPISQGKMPILGLDVWEHAYYLKYQNRRPEYIENWWNVVNWGEVERRYKEAK